MTLEQRVTKLEAQVKQILETLEDNGLYGNNNEEEDIILENLFDAEGA